MGKKILITKRFISSLRMLPHIFFYYKYQEKLDIDLVKFSRGRLGVKTFIDVCTYQKVYRNLFYYRIGKYKSFFIKWLLPPKKSLSISCNYIGVGAHFEHNFWTFLNANSIGDNFYCLHSVTLGMGKTGKPVVGNNVKIFTGAGVFGDIRIGNNVTIGAGAIVLKDIPDNCTVVGNPAYIIKKDGKKVNIKL